MPYRVLPMMRFYKQRFHFFFTIKCLLAIFLTPHSHFEDSAIHKLVRKDSTNVVP